MRSIPRVGSSVCKVWLVFISGVVVALLVLLCVHYRTNLFPPPPTYAITVLGFVAVAMTLVLPRDPGKLQKSCWMAAAFVLMFFEIWAVSHDRKDQNTKHQAELAAQQQQFQKSLTHFETIELDVKRIPNIEGEIAEQPKINISQTAANNFGNLKERTADLVAVITKLIQHRYDQLRNAPAYAPPLTQQKMEEWERSNDVEFRAGAFGFPVQSAKQLRDEFAQFHMRDNQLDEILDEDDRNQLLAKQSGMPFVGWLQISEMQIVADRLSALAAKLP